MDEAARVRCSMLSCEHPERSAMITDGRTNICWHCIVTGLIVFASANQGRAEDLDGSVRALPHNILSAIRDRRHQQILSRELDAITREQYEREVLYLDHVLGKESTIFV